MTSSLFRRRLGIRAGYEMLRHRQLRMDRLNASVSIQADDGGMYTHVLLTWYYAQLPMSSRRTMTLNKLGYTDICFYIFLWGLGCHGHLQFLLKNEQLNFF